MLPQSSAPMDLFSATEALKRHQRSIAEDGYLSDPHARVHRASTGSQHCYQRWQRDWSRDQCVTVAQVALAILRCSSLPAPYRALGLGHLPTLSRRRRNSRASGVNVQPTIRPGGTRGLETILQQTHDAFGVPGTDWGGDPPPLTGNDIETE